MDVEDTWIVVVRQAAAGAVVLILTALAVAVVTVDTCLAGRVVIVAGVTGALAALVSDWRARMVVTGTAVLLFVMVLGDGVGARSWHFTPLVVVAAVFGAGYRCLGAVPDGRTPA